MKEGYYWAVVTFEEIHTGKPEIVFVLGGVNIVQRVGEEYHLDFCDVDFGESPEPIEPPAWLTP